MNVNVKSLLSLDFTFLYLDNIFVNSKGEEEHLWHLLEVMSRPQLAGLMANTENCEFGLPPLTSWATS